MRKAVLAGVLLPVFVFAAPVQAQLLGGLLGDGGLVDVDAGNDGLSVSVGGDGSPVDANVSVGGGSGVSVDANAGGDGGVSAEAGASGSGVTASVSVGGSSGVTAGVDAGSDGVGVQAGIGGAGVSASVGSGGAGPDPSPGRDGADVQSAAGGDSGGGSAPGGAAPDGAAGGSVPFSSEAGGKARTATGNDSGGAEPPSRLYMLARLIEAREWRHLSRVLADGMPDVRHMDIRRWVGRSEVRDLPGVLVEKGVLIARMQQALAGHAGLFADKGLEMSRIIAIDIRADGSIFVLLS